MISAAFWNVFNPQVKMLFSHLMTFGPYWLVLSSKHLLHLSMIICQTVDTALKHSQIEVRMVPNRLNRERENEREVEMRPLSFAHSFG